MTSPVDPNSTMWGIPPTLSRKFEPSNDLVCLVVWNLNENKGITLKTSRPFVVFVRLANQLVTGISGRELNEAIANLSRAGVAVIERDNNAGWVNKADWVNSPDEFKPPVDLVRFMFYLEYEDEQNLPMDKPWEVDAKQAVKWPDDFAKMEAVLLQEKSSSPVADSNNLIDL